MNTTGPPLSDGSPTHLADCRFHLPDAADRAIASATERAHRAGPDRWRG
jgi:hypothetical protein